MRSFRLETIIGLGLLVLLILGFLLSVILQLPKSAEVTKQAQPLTEIPRDLFSSDNELTKSVRLLSTPNNVPVTVDPATIGRGNVFENF